MPRRESEVVVALNGGVLEDGTPNYDTRARVELAAGVAMEHEVRALIMSGANSQAMREYALEEVNSDLQAVWVETNSRDTIGNAHFTKMNLVLPANTDRHEVHRPSITDITVVTADYHAGRAEWIFKHVFGPDFKVWVRGAESPYSPEEKLKLLNREASALRAARLLLWGVPPNANQTRQHRLNGHMANLARSYEHKKTHHK